MKSFDFDIKRGLIDNLNRKLKITEEFLKFQNKDTRENSYTTFLKDDISEYRYGVRWISFKVIYGREYLIYVKDKKSQVLKISFKSYFGKNKINYHNKFINILNALWESYFDNIVNDYLNKFEIGEEFTLNNVTFYQDKIQIEVAGIVKHKKVDINWESVRTRNYHTYFVIYSNENPSEINRTYKYLDEYNAAVLFSVIQTIIKNKEIEQ